MTEATMHRLSLVATRYLKLQAHWEMFVRHVFASESLRARCPAFGCEGDRFLVSIGGHRVTVTMLPKNETADIVYSASAQSGEVVTESLTFEPNGNIQKMSSVMDQDDVEELHAKAILKVFSKLAPTAN